MHEVELIFFVVNYTYSEKNTIGLEELLILILLLYPPMVPRFELQSFHLLKNAP